MSDWPDDELARRRLKLDREKACTVGFADIAEFVRYLLAAGASPGLTMEHLHDLWRTGKISSTDLSRGMDACAR